MSIPNADDTPANPLDREISDLFKMLAEKSGVTLPPWFKASLVADVDKRKVSLVFEVPATVGAIKSCLEKQ